MLVNFMGSSLDPRTSLLAFFTAQYVCTSHSGVRVYHDFHLCNHQMHWVQPRFVVILGLKENLYMGDIWTGKMTAHETMKMTLCKESLSFLGEVTAQHIVCYTA